MKTKQQTRQSVFFENNGEEFDEYTGVNIRACTADDDYPMEVSVELEDGTLVGFAFNKEDVRRFVAEAYSTGAV